MYSPPKYPLTLNALDEISSIYNLVEDEDVDSYRLVCPVSCGSPKGKYVIRKGVDF